MFRRVILALILNLVTTAGAAQTHYCRNGLLLPREDQFYTSDTACETHLGVYEYPDEASWQAAREAWAPGPASTACCQNMLTGEFFISQSGCDEGNLIRREEISTGYYREFVWDHRNRLTQVLATKSSLLHGVLRLHPLRGLRSG